TYFVVVRVADDTDDFARIWFVVVAFENNALTKCRRAVKEFFRKRLVHDNGVCAILRIARLEHTALFQRNLHGPAIIGIDRQITAAGPLGPSGPAAGPQS